MAKRTCSIDGCEKPVVGWGWCGKHYQRWKKHGDPLGSAPKGPTGCAVDGCDRPHEARGWCARHYARWRRWGDPEVDRPEPIEHNGFCILDGCDKPHLARGYCSAHYRKLKLYGDPLASRKPERQTCAIDGCDDPVKGRGWCQRHYKRWRDHGDPMPDVEPILRGRGAIKRFLQKVDQHGPVPEYAPHLGPCWIWTARLDEQGYGSFSSDSGTLAHRFSYEHHVGPIPEGLHLDHLCRVRSCVRPTHLEPVTAQVNVRRGIAPPAINARKTHCVRGHPLDGPGADVAIDANGGRSCRACVRSRYYEKRYGAEPR